MRSISTMRGDAGETSLAGGVRISKASARVETYGTIDELNSTMGFARSICEGSRVAFLRVSLLAMQPACRRQLHRVDGAAPRRRRCVKSVLLNVLLDARGHQTGDRLACSDAPADRSR